MQTKSITVSQLNRYIARVLSTDPILMSVAVKGEVSRITKHGSGNWFFDLKDSDSRISCFLPASRVSTLRYEVSEGMEFTVFGNINVFERSGSYSLFVTDIQAEGEGALAAAFEQLKKKLEAEGLFDPAHKKQLPAFPRKIGVVTSPTGAVIKDIAQTLRRRDPLVEILLYPALVQGPGSAATVCEGIKFFNEKRPDTDIIIIGRGGGSLEDLWTFNEESVARAVYASAIPVISAVGHESDHVISDLAADLRASTPTAAAELCAPHIDNLKDRVRSCSPAAVFDILLGRVELQETVLQRLKDGLDSAAVSRITYLSNRLSIAAAELKANDPMSVLKSGYTAVKDADGCWRSKAEGLKAGDRITLVFRDGSAGCTVNEVALNE